MTVRDPVQTSFIVPWSDTDAAGIVYFGNYLKYFEAGEFALYHRLGTNVRIYMQEHNIWLPRVDVNCRFYTPIRWEDEVIIQLSVSRLTRRSVRYEIQLERDSTLLCEGAMTVVCVDSEAFRARPFPEELREVLGSALDSA